MIENGQHGGGYILNYGGYEIPFQVEPSRRSALTIHVHPDLRLEVLAPLDKARPLILERVEVADIGRTLARTAGRRLEELNKATPIDTECILAIVENACLLHDIGNPPFGHFGEESIKSWFKHEAIKLLPKEPGVLDLATPDECLSDFHRFDGNPQGFRIATRLHSEGGECGLNLTCSTLLATIKYPYCEPPAVSSAFGKKQGVFKSEKDRYEQLCERCGIAKGRRYFLAYLMELADDICYCLSDIADSFEKKIITSREYKDEMRSICKETETDPSKLIPDAPINTFSHQVAIQVATAIIKEASDFFATHIDQYLSGQAKELSEDLETGKLLKCLKTFSGRFIYTSPDAQRLEIAGSRIVSGLLEHYGMLLSVPRADFEHFISQQEMRRGSGLDIQWRVFNQLSKRMIEVYKRKVRANTGTIEEWIERARLITDFISGMTDDSARDFYQNFMGISV